MRQDSKALHARAAVLACKSYGASMQDKLNIHTASNKLWLASVNCFSVKR